MFRKYFIALILLSLFTFRHSTYAQLIVNEFSQGASGNKEYIEFVVKGQATCNNSCADLRGWIFDDNNGWYGTTAVSPGCYRFKNDANWACVPYGSIIVVYNSGDFNPNVPADDPTDANNDHVYVLPVNSNYIEMNGTVPNTSSMTYPSGGFGTSTGWTNMALNNTNDAVQTIDPNNLTASYHAVSYGSGVVSPVHITTSGSQKVYYLSNNLYDQSASWVAGSVPSNETPGAANTVANGTWISDMLSGSIGGGAFNDTTAASICQGGTYNFNGTNYNIDGYYTDTLISTGGCDSVVTLHLTVYPIPVAPSVVSPISYCQQSNAINLTATGQNLLWYNVPTGDTGVANAPLPSTLLADTLAFYVSQTVNGCESPRAQIHVIINPKPLPPTVTSSSLVLCQGTPAFALTAQGQNLLWYNNPLAMLGTTTTPIINTNNGHSETWYVTQTVNGCESDSIPIAIRISTIHAAFNISADTLCISDSLMATNLSTGNDYINHWNFGDGFSYVNLNQNHKYVVPGVYTISLGIKNTDGCKDTARSVVWVSPLPEVRFSVDKSELCMGDHAMIDLKYTAGFGFLHWDFGDGNISEMDDRSNVVDRGHQMQTELQHAYDRSGIFYFTTHYYTPGCGMRAGKDSVIVHEMPKVDLGPDTALCLHGKPIPLKNLYPKAADETYNWSTGETTTEITARHPDDITLTVTTPYCTNADVVHVSKDCYIDVPNAFTPNGDGENDYFFPRQLLSSSVSNFQMQILNRWGQMVFETHQTDGRGWDGRLSGKDQPGGVYVYLIKVSFTNGESEAYQGNVTLLR